MNKLNRKITLLFFLVIIFFSFIAIYLKSNFLEINSLMTSDFHETYRHSTKLQVDSRNFVNELSEFSISPKQSKIDELRKYFDIIIVRISTISSKGGINKIYLKKCNEMLLFLTEQISPLINDDPIITEKNISKIKELMLDFKKQEQFITNLSDETVQGDIYKVTEILEDQNSKALLFILFINFSILIIIYLWYKQQKTSRELKINEEKLQAILDNAGTIIYVKDIKGSYILVNKKFEKVFNKDRKDIIGSKDNEIFSNEIAEVFVNNDKKVLNEGITIKVEENFNFNDEDHSYLSIKFALKDSEDNIYALGGIATDITELKIKEKELNYFKNYLSNIIDSMPSMLIGVDNDGIITQWNDKVVQTTGISTSKAIGNSFEKIIPRFSSELIKIKEAIKTKRQLVDTKRVYIDDDKNVNYEDVTIYPLISNGVEGAVIRIDDVTEKIRIEEMMIQSEKMMSVGGLAAGMAHEINNPLAGMIQTSSIIYSRLTEKLPANERVAKELGITIDIIKKYMENRQIPKMLDNINLSGKRVASIVTNMLSFARKGTDGMSTCDISEILDKTIELANNDYNLKKHFDF